MMTEYAPPPPPAVKRKQHSWTLDDNRAVRDEFIKAGCKVLQQNDPVVKGLSRRLGIKVGSISLKMSNFKYLETKGKEGKSQYSNGAKIVWDEYLRNEGIP
ncbi:MAG: hypothetical protein ISN28_15220 [Ectothiorhodospiraceae bacterium AqS1]|nr:hypothetical protein [Ectothiorhodospiraceae bacterium AqS1]